MLLPVTLTQTLNQYGFTIKTMTYQFDSGTENGCKIDLVALLKCDDLKSAKYLAPLALRGCLTFTFIV